MKRLFDFVKMISEMKGINDDGYELAEILIKNEIMLKHLCDLIYDAKSDYEYVKEIL